MTTTLSASVVEPDPILNTGDLPARGKLPKTRLRRHFGATPTHQTLYLLG
jgi:hypothetical protein